MNTVSIRLAEKLKRPFYLLFQSNSGLTGLSSGSIYRKEQGTSSKQDQLQRKAFIGNFFAGPQFLFHPLLEG